MKDKSMKEQWERWEPIKGLSKKYFIESICNSGVSFIVLLAENENKKNKLKITFENSMCAYRCADETYRTKLIEELHEKYGKELYGSWIFFKVQNSDYIKEIYEQSEGSLSNKLIQFSFLEDLILDVIADKEPMVELIE